MRCASSRLFAAPVSLALATCTSEPAPSQPPGLGCGSETIDRAMDCVDSDQYLSDLSFIAKPRPPKSAHWQAVQDLCADRFAELGIAIRAFPGAPGLEDAVRIACPGDEPSFDRLLRALQTLFGTETAR